MIILPVFKGRTPARIVAHALIDDSDWFLTQYRWRLHSDGYVYRTTRLNRKTRFIYLHREVMWHEGPQEISHLNSNPLDNQTANLRVTSNSENKLNPNDRVRGQSQYRGVTKDNNRQLNKPWRGKIKVNNRYYCTARYTTDKEAAIALNIIRKSLGLPIDLRVAHGELPAGYGNLFSRSRRKTRTEGKQHAQVL